MTKDSASIMSNVNCKMSNVKYVNVNSVNDVNKVNNANSKNNVNNANSVNNVNNVNNANNANNAKWHMTNIKCEMLGKIITSGAVSVDLVRSQYILWDQRRS